MAKLLKRYSRVSELSPEELEAQRAYDRERFKKKYKPISELTLEEQEKRRAKQRRANERRRLKYRQDREYREQMKLEKKRIYIEKRPEIRQQQNQRYAEENRVVERQALRRVSGWRWGWNGKHGAREVDFDYEHRQAMDWYEQWFESLDNPDLSPW